MALVSAASGVKIDQTKSQLWQQSKRDFLPSCSKCLTLSDGLIADIADNPLIMVVMDLLVRASNLVCIQDVFDRANSHAIVNTS